jgi:crossover junction endodeoxyribonuclease RuvC
MILLGLDPGLERTGWGVIEAHGNRLLHRASGHVQTRPAEPLCARLATLFAALETLIAQHRPEAAAVEETYVNANPRSTLKLGQARGVVLLAAARTGALVGQYPPATIKKAVVGTGGADKAQVHAMVRILLPGCAPATPDAADALAVAICHAHHLASARRVLAA